MKTPLFDSVGTVIGYAHIAFGPSRGAGSSGRCRWSPGITGRTRRSRRTGSFDLCCWPPIAFLSGLQHQTQLTEWTRRSRYGYRWCREPEPGLLGLQMECPWGSAPRGLPPEGLGPWIPPVPVRVVTRFSHLALRRGVGSVCRRLQGSRGPSDLGSGHRGHCH